MIFKILDETQSSPILLKIITRPIILGKIIQFCDYYVRSVQLICGIGLLIGFLRKLEYNNQEN